MDENKEEILCHCNGNCLNEQCPFFMKGKYCNKNCKCPNCRNKPEFEAERSAAFIQILFKNPLAFTPEEPLTQDELTAISNFAMLTKSVNKDPFKLEPQETPLSKVISPKVLELSVVTIISAANEILDTSKNQKTFEEDVENSVASEFNNILKQIQDRINQ